MERRQQPFRAGDTPSKEELKGCGLGLGVVAGLLAALFGIGLLWNLIAGDDTSEQSFQEAVDAGWSCDRLYQLRNDQDPDWPGIDEANNLLQEIGCSGPDASRQATTSLEVVADASCLEAVRQTDLMYNDATNADLEDSVRRSLMACSTWQEWLAAAKAFPGATGASRSSAVTVDSLWYCEKWPSTTVCTDLRLNPPE